MAINGKDIIEIGKDLAEKHPEIKDYSEEARLKEFRKIRRRIRNG